MITFSNLMILLLTPPHTDTSVPNTTTHRLWVLQIFGTLVLWKLPLNAPQKGGHRGSVYIWAQYEHNDTACKAHGHWAPKSKFCTSTSIIRWSSACAGCLCPPDTPEAIAVGRTGFSSEGGGSIEPPKSGGFGKRAQLTGNSGAKGAENFFGH